MSKFWELLEESVIVQSLITLFVIGAIVGLVIAGREIPELLGQLALLIIGFYFGSKGQVGARQAADRAVQRLLWEEKDE